VGRFDGQTVLVTGAAQGLGRAAAQRFAREGARVAVNDALAAELGGIAVPGDVADPEAVRALVAQAESATGRVDVLVSNAAYMTMSPFLEHDLDDWWRVVDVNLGGTFLLAQAVVPGMRRHGSGRIVVVSSEWGVVGWPEATAYSASKAGLVALVKTLGRELAPYGIGVNGLAPSVVDTPQLQVDADAAGVSLDEIRRRYAEQVPLGRVQTVEEAAAALAFLADPRLPRLVGQVLCSNGGTTRSRV
jgi:NAD(P)-dependent dehydrogenase (short-subunit alcohol dehydrogenase family)